MFVISVAERCQQASVFVYRCVCVMWLRCVCARNGSSHLTCPTHTGREREWERERERKTSADLLMAVLWIWSVYHEAQGLYIDRRRY